MGWYFRVISIICHTWKKTSPNDFEFLPAGRHEKNIRESDVFQENSWCLIILHSFAGNTCLRFEQYIH
jgi:hypothetical protein